LIARQQVIGSFSSFAVMPASLGQRRALLQSFADQAAIAVQNAQLYTQVTSDKQRMDACSIRPRMGF